MKFVSNRDVAVGVENLTDAIKFFEDTLGFKPTKIEKGLRVYDTMQFTFYIKEGDIHPPILSFTVEDLNNAKEYLINNRCNILVERENSLYFRDPTGQIWDIIEG